MRARTLLLALLPLWPGAATAQEAPGAAARITHGPILGRPSSDGVGVWVRSSRPARFRVLYSDTAGTPLGAATGETRLESDNTGWVLLSGLAPGSAYHYEVRLDGTESAGASTPTGGSFRTLPASDHYHDPVHNPRGLFNFSFTHGSCNFQFARDGHGHDMPAYAQMLERIGDKVHFQIMNGDWLYEARRRTTVDAWRKENGVARSEVPEPLRLAPQLAGVWANYKLYLDRSPSLAAWHRNVPTIFTFDDHELLNDINGTADPGRRDKRTLFRDIGVQGWRDYLGWANPLPQGTPETHFGTAILEAGSGVLVDDHADFASLDPARMGTLHVHWNDDHPAAGVYEIVRVIDGKRLEIRPAPPADGTALAYSIGMRNQYRQRVANAEFFVLDTRGHREMHDIEQPAKPELSMIGDAQKQWLLDGMRNSDADFFFVVSTVTFTIPHVSVKQPDKDESWTVYLDEREQLFRFFEGLGKPVFLLTGDLHNSFAVRVSDNVWEFVSGPQNSPNHDYTEEGDRPASGDFTYNGRTVNIRWSSFWLDDVPREFLRQPYYSVVQVNNVIHNPGPDGRDRWVAYPQPQVVFQYYDGLTGDLVYAESVAIPARRK